MFVIDTQELQDSVVSIVNPYEVDVPALVRELDDVVPLKVLRDTEVDFHVAMALTPARVGRHVYLN
jgi:hypothetical protein